MLFWGKSNSLDIFYKETGIEQLPTQQVHPLLFLAATKGRQPIIVLLDNGKIVDLYKSTNIDEGAIVDFLQ